MDEQALDAIIEQFKTAIAKFTKEMLGGREVGEIPPEELAELLTDEAIEEWGNKFAEAIALYHQSAAVVGNNGEPLTEEQSLKIGDTVATQIQYLTDFALRIRTDKDFDRSQLVRADMYANATRQSLFQAVTKFLPLPAMPAEGTLCYTNCKCGWRIETIDEANEDYDCYWERSANDSCPTCVARARRWNPLRIRGGIIE